MAFKYGNTLYPADATGATTLLPVCDPALAKILDFLAFMVRKNLDDAVVDVAGLVKTANQALPIESAIEQVAPIDPESIAKSEQWQFPLFCAWRKSTVYTERTGNWIQDVCKVGVAYILPPLTAIQSIRVMSALTSVSEIVNYALNTGHDSDYNNDERIVRDNNIAKVRLLTGEFGPYAFDGKKDPPFWPAWVGEIELTLQQTPYVVGLTDLAGTDFTVTQQALDTVSTFVAANASVGATSLQVASSAGFKLLDVIVIGEGTAREERISVTAIPNATHLTLAAPGLVFAHTALQADVVATSPVTIVSAKSEVG